MDLIFYRGTAYQSEYGGVGGLFRSFFRSAIPLFKSGAKAIGKQILKSGLDVMSDISRGDKPKQAAQRRFKEAGKILTDKAASKVKTMIGSGKGIKSEDDHKKESVYRKLRNGDEYLDLTDSYIHVKAKITKSGGAPLPDNEPVAPVNLFLHSLFSQVDVSLNDRIISSASNTYPYRAYLETLLNYGEDAKKSLLSCEAFFKDDKPYQVDPVSEEACESLKKCYQLMANNRTLDMIGQLHCDIFQQNRLMLNLVDMKIKMIRSKPNFCLLSTNNSEYNVVLEHASLFVRKVKVSPGVSLGHAKALKNTSAKYPTDKVVCKTYSIPKGSLSFMQDNVFLGSMPKRLIITFVKNAAINGQYSLNPFNFKHHKLNFLGIYLDGQPVPCKPMELNYESEN
ncbi:Uncharacterized protein F54H12.2 [Araneus ventricosus]|uniref:Uncharacterized protein F54H12.2 n=1 Tax=Araneus ventricosus TaxID=182803 RepID=A0A4Y2Q0G2_ARAVE|nr:Uncharacterized protein F54H12.2 [Araneus ventricosus]